MSGVLKTQKKKKKNLVDSKSILIKKYKEQKTFYNDHGFSFRQNIYLSIYYIKIVLLF